MKIKFNELPEFQKELKQLAKKYKSLPGDLQEFCRVVPVNPFGSSKHCKVITQTEILSIIKSRFFCRYLKGSSLRIVYAYIESNTTIEFIELYYKGDKENENSERIKEYLKKYK